MPETSYSFGEGLLTRVSLSLSEETAAEVERERRGRILDEYLADYARRNGPVSAEEQQRAGQLFDEVCSGEECRVAD
ncbi:hypothetical protein [Nonomuraea sp. NPDC049400]|uniref:hypothetical protein n=1 Tax=Nonomuraea sp. NPDC049400 TaxID=3364352 RepID=UPI00379AFCC7